MFEKWLKLAEVFDAWRVVPRLTLAAYAVWLYAVTHDILLWYFGLPAAERTLETSGLAGAVITAVTGMCTWVFKIYVEGGRTWATEKAE